MVPIEAKARSSVEIENSCNDCCTSCFGRKVRHKPHTLKKVDTAVATAVSHVDPIPPGPHDYMPTPFMSPSTIDRVLSNPPGSTK